MNKRIALIGTVVIGIAAFGWVSFHREHRTIAAVQKIPESQQALQEFLWYVPPKEPGAPHNMKWIVEHDAGDGGYYGTKYTPGNLLISQLKNINIRFYQDGFFQNGNYDLNTRLLMVGDPVNHTAWQVNWNLGEFDDYKFLVFPLAHSKQWMVFAENKTAMSVMAKYDIEFVDVFVKPEYLH